MMKAVKISITLCLLIAAPVLVQAQSASKHFPDDKAGFNVPAGTETMAVRANFGVTPDINTGPPNGHFSVTGPKTGAEIATQTANRLCEEAVASYATCTGNIGFPACAGTACCAAVPDLPYTLLCDNGAGAGFSLGLTHDIAPLGSKFIVSTIGQALDALNHNTRAGNTVGTDPLPTYLIRVDKGAVDGVVGFSVDTSPPGAPVSFNVNTTGLDDLALHQAIRTGFLGLNLGLAAVVRPATEAQVHSHVQEAFNGYFVHIPNAAAKGVLEINVSGLPGQDTVVETAVFKGKPIPALGAGGMLFLTLLLTLTGAWMLHRRRREA